MQTLTTGGIRRASDTVLYSVIPGMSQFAGGIERYLNAAITHSHYLYSYCYLKVLVLLSMAAGLCLVMRLYIPR